MLYKEWLTGRVKLLGMASIYPLVAVFVYISWQEQISHCITVSLLSSWLPISALLTILVAAVAGADLFSEEKTKNTLSFLLSRPLRRANIYHIKLGLTIAFLVGVSSLTDLVMSGLAGNRSYCNFNGRELLTNLPPPQLSPEVSLSYYLLTLVCGVGIICLSGITSQIARTAIEGIILNLAVLFGLVIFITLIQVPFYDTFQVYYWQLLSMQGKTLVWVLTLVMLPLAFGLYSVGLVWFRRREF